MKTFLSIVTVLMVLFGSVWVFLPESMLRSWGVHSDAVGVYVGRRCGVLLFGYAAIFWLCRGAEPLAGLTAVLGGAAFAATLMLLLSLWGVLAGTVGRGIWVAVAIEVILAGGFWYYFLAERTT